MPRKNRKSISVRGVTYAHIKSYCKEVGVSIADRVQTWADEKLRAEKPKDPHHVYEVWSTLTSRHVAHVVAPSTELAQKWASERLDVAPQSLDIRPTTRPYDSTRITYAHLGVVTDSELAELCP